MTRSPGRVGPPTRRRPRWRRPWSAGAGTSPAASHELRSPVASLRTQLEVGAAHPGLLGVAGAVEDTVRLQRLAADLLLARLDAGEGPGPGARVDLVAPAREEAVGRPGVTVSAAGPAAAGGSRVQLGWVPASLLDNAQRHARCAVAVTVREEGCGDDVRAVGTSTTTGTGCPRRTGSGSSSGSCGWTTRGPGTTEGRARVRPSPGTPPCGTAARSRWVTRRQAGPGSGSACRSSGTRGTSRAHVHALGRGPRGVRAARGGAPRWA